MPTNLNSKLRPIQRPRAFDPAGLGSTCWGLSQRCWSLVQLGPVTAQLRVAQDHKADRINAARENARTEHDPARTRKVAHAGREEMAETQEVPHRPRPYKLRKFYEYPRKIQRTMAIRQLLRGDLFGHVKAPLQVAQDVEERHKTDPTNAGRETARTGKYPAKTCRKLHPERGDMAETWQNPLLLRLRKMCRVGLLAARGVTGRGNGSRLTNVWKAICCLD